MERVENSEKTSGGLVIPLRRPIKISEVPDDKALALFDLDGTLTEPRNELLIQRFLDEVKNLGNHEARQAIGNRFKRWAEENDRGANPDYQEYLTDVGVLWAKILATNGYGLTRPELMQITEKWFEDVGRLEVKDYAGGVISVVKEKN